LLFHSNVLPVSRVIDKQTNLLYGRNFIRLTILFYMICLKRAIQLFVCCNKTITCLLSDKACSRLSARVTEKTLKDPLLTRQEAQLPLRNRASAMHFFVDKLLSNAVITYSYICHLRNLRLANLLRTQGINFSMRPQHVHDVRPHCRLMSPSPFYREPQNPCEYPHKLYIARN